MQMGQLWQVSQWTVLLPPCGHVVPDGFPLRSSGMAHPPGNWVHPGGGYHCTESVARATSSKETACPWTILLVSFWE